MAEPVKTRWDLGAGDLERLTAEARLHRGESLWRDAWRRLRRARPAFLALVFLGAFGLVSLLVPLLPIPSPIAMSLRTRASAPEWPFATPRPPEEAPEAGSAPTRAVKNLWNDGWRHRTVLAFEHRPAAAADGAAADPRALFEPLRARVEALAGDAAVLFHAPVAGPGGELGTDVHVAVPLDRAAVPGRDSDAGLAARVAASLASDPLASPLAGSLAFAGVRHEHGYWPLGALDRLLVRGRIALFGLWQTGNWLGTDPQGRDLLARILWGSRTSILVALMAAATSLLIGVTYGATSGYVGGRVDNVMMRIVDVLYSVPFIFVVIFLITIVNEYRTELEDRYGIDREVVFFVVIGAIYWLTMARVVRGQVLQLKHTEFVEAARVIGASTPRVIAAHLVPNVLSIVIVYLTLTIPAVMLFEAFLSFLGLGIEPPKVSWGLLARDGTEAINPLDTAWWLVVFPALAMGSTLLALNVLGDGLRDALDPKMRGRS